MTVTVPDELRFARPRWVVVFGMLRPLLLAVAMVAYGLALGGAGLWMVLYYVSVAATFGYAVVVGLASLWAQVTGPAPGLTADGVQLRVSMPFGAGVK